MVSKQKIRIQVYLCLVLGLPFLITGQTVRAEIIDTDGDGYSDEEEIQNGYSPFNPEPLEIKKSDPDGDGLNDEWELKFGTDPYQADTDGDGYNDLKEIDKAYSPLSSEPVRLDQKIEVSLKEQVMLYKVADVVWKRWLVSTGKANMSTPTGEYMIINKAPKPWSKAYGLWMPYWLGLGGNGLRSGSIGIHELPVWPGGYREGQDHLGTPVSHGCIRLGVGAAEYLYERVEPGVAVIIK